MASSRNREVFFLTAVAISLGAAWVSGQLGLSLALGAFFAGFMFANTDFSDMLIGEILPFRHVFVSVFFVSIGLLFDVRFALDNAGLLAMSVGLVLLVNFVLMAVIIVGFGFPPRVALAAGLILSQIGEFSFLLLEAAKRHGIGAEIYNVFLSTAFLTMLATPMLFALVPLIFKLTEMIPVLGLHPSRKLPVAEEPPSSAHVIVCGFGPAGRDLAATFMEENIPFVVLEMNARQVHLARRLGVRVIYGDAANAEVMRRAAVSRASAVIVSFADPLDLEQIVKLVQRLNPKTTVAVRTRYEQDMPRLYELGADIVVTEEWEASQELNRVILHHFDVGHDRIVHHLERIRARKELAIEEAILSRRPSDELKQKLKTGG
jgi:CPA2 family monovalent cation:H+ antiporter-2